MSKRAVEIAILHSATMIFGAYVSEKTLSQDKLPGATLSWEDGRGLWILVKDKKKERVYEQLLPYTAFENILFQEETKATQPTTKTKQ